jgi:hypothetical protein
MNALRIEGRQINGRVVAAFGFKRHDFADGCRKPVRPSAGAIYDEIRRQPPPVLEINRRTALVGAQLAHVAALKLHTEPLGVSPKRAGVILRIGNRTP